MRPTPSLSLQTLLALDAATCTAMAGLLTLAAEPIAQLTQLPPHLLFGAGLALLPVAGFMALQARRTCVPRWAARVVIWGNGLWVAISLLLPLTRLVTPNATGWAFLVLQALAVAGLALAEARALHRNDGIIRSGRNGETA
ncbi:hypothetical protein [Rhodobacter sp. NSM]|uniref:hypothetical protein n=1 Tax=Rhodobacter sp. NSM TaxID=3457501 RepID=UPI003FD48F43